MKKGLIPFVNEAVFQVPVPSKRHEDIRQNQQKDGNHRVGAPRGEFRNCLPPVSARTSVRVGADQPAR